MLQTGFDYMAANWPARTMAVLFVCLGSIGVLQLCFRCLFRERWVVFPEPHHPFSPRFVPLITGLCGFWWLLDPRGMPGTHPEPVSLQLFGLFLMITGTAFWAWSQLTMGANWNSRIGLRAGHELVSAGPYAYVRHPIYSGFLVASLGFALASSNWLVGGSVIVYSWATVLRAGAEEKLLEKAFGETYRAYVKRTGRFFPRLRLRR